jgi:hypothetical protein
MTSLKVFGFIGFAAISQNSKTAGAIGLDLSAPNG